MSALLATSKRLVEDRAVILKFIKQATAVILKFIKQATRGSREGPRGACVHFSVHTCSEPGRSGCLLEGAGGAKSRHSADMEAVHWELVVVHQ